MTTDVKELVTTVRPKTHGEYSDVAEVEQSLKNLFRLRPNWGKLSCIQRASLDMFAHKIGRILAGDPDFVDHWVDIAGYAQLIVDRLPKEKGGGA